MIRTRLAEGPPRLVGIDHDRLPPDQSILPLRRDPELYPELAQLASDFSRIRIERHWESGRLWPLRRPQDAELPTEVLLTDGSNAALVLGDSLHKDPERLSEAMSRFLLRFRRLSTRVVGGQIMFYLHEDGLDDPVPATRLSDGTIRFPGLLAALLAPKPPPLVGLEEQEGGLHPDAPHHPGALLLEASTRTQILVTTHSESLVTALGDQPEVVTAVVRVSTARRQAPMVGWASSGSTA